MFCRPLTTRSVTDQGSQLLCSAPRQQPSTVGILHRTSWMAPGLTNNLAEFSLRMHGGSEHSLSNFLSSPLHLASDSPWDPRPIPASPTSPSSFPLKRIFPCTFNPVLASPSERTQTNTLTVHILCTTFDYSVGLFFIGL